MIALPRVKAACGSARTKVPWTTSRSLRNGRPMDGSRKLGDRALNSFMRVRAGRRAGRGGRAAWRESTKLFYEVPVGDEGGGGAVAEQDQHRREPRLTEEPECQGGSYNGRGRAGRHPGAALNDETQ